MSDILWLLGSRLNETPFNIRIPMSRFCDYLTIVKFELWNMRQSYSIIESVYLLRLKVNKSHEEFLLLSHHHKIWGFQYDKMEMNIKFPIYFNL